MIHPRRRGAKRPRRVSTFRPTFELLEPRLVLSTNAEQPVVLYVENGHPVSCGCPTCPGGAPAIVQNPEFGPTDDITPFSPAAAGSPLSSIPALHSYPGGKATLYLDFNGHFEAQWGSYRDILTPAFDMDGDPTSFSSSELAAIQQIWSYVAEDYAPFNINVTTVEPPSFANGVALRVVIGGNGAWTGGVYGGISYIGSFTNSIPNTAFVFSKNLGNGHVKYVADAISHEAGHAFGLHHQGTYSGTTRVTEYSTGEGQSRAPLMGNSYLSRRSVWWYGTTTSPSTYQDDMAVIASSINGFGYRPDDHGNTMSTATALKVSGNQVSAAGIIERTSDVDYFSFTTGAGRITLTVSVLPDGNNLDTRLELRNSVGTLLIVAAPQDDFGASITTTVSAGTYYLVVASQGNYGDVGQYWISGTIVPPSTTPAPTNLDATAVSANQIRLTWKDNSANETGFWVQRTTSGSSWTTIASLPPNSTSFVDTGLSAGTTYVYRVAALIPNGGGAYSSQASTITLPPAPTGFRSTVVSSSQINLFWNDGVGETGYQIERSLNGTNWTLIATTGANATSYQDKGLTAATTYYYRMRAVNASGPSGYSGAINGRTMANLSAPAAPSNLIVVSVSSTQVNLAWQDNSNNETNFVIQRSENNGLNWTTVGRVWPNVRTFTDLRVSPNRTYHYRVYAENASGVSPFTNTVRATTPGSGATLLLAGALPSHPAALAPLIEAILAGDSTAQSNHSPGSMIEHAQLVDVVFLLTAKQKDE